MNAKDIAKELQKPFKKDLVERHYSGSHYVAWPSYQQRLDDVVGPTGWRTSFTEEHNEKGNLTRVDYTVSVQYGDVWVDRVGHWILEGRDKWHLAHSKAFRRACVGHGIGRYLYKDSDIETPDEPTQEERVQQPVRPPEFQESVDRTKTQVEVNLLDIHKVGKEHFGEREWPTRARDLMEEIAPDVGDSSQMTVMQTEKMMVELVRIVNGERAAPPLGSADWSVEDTSEYKEALAIAKKTGRPQAFGIDDADFSGIFTVYENGSWQHGGRPGAVRRAVLNDME